MIDRASMAPFDETVNHVLGLLDRHFFQTLEQSVQQFKEQKQKFHESVCANVQLRNLKPQSSSGVCRQPETHALLYPLPADSKKSSAIKPEIENSYCADAQAEKKTGQKYSLRPRAARKLDNAQAPPQRLTRSTAKQLAANPAASCSISSELDLKCQERESKQNLGKGSVMPEHHNPHTVTPGDKEERVAASGLQRVSEEVMRESVRGMILKQTPKSDGMDLSSTGVQRVSGSTKVEVTSDVQSTHDNKSSLSPDMRIDKDMYALDHRSSGLKHLIPKNSPVVLLGSPRTADIEVDRQHSQQTCDERDLVIRVTSDNPPLGGGVILANLPLCELNDCHTFANEVKGSRLAVLDSSGCQNNDGSGIRVQQLYSNVDMDSEQECQKTDASNTPLQQSKSKVLSSTGIDDELRNSTSAVAKNWSPTLRFSGELEAFRFVFDVDVDHFAMKIKPENQAINSTFQENSSPLVAGSKPDLCGASMCLSEDVKLAAACLSETEVRFESAFKDSGTRGDTRTTVGDGADGPELCHQDYHAGNAQVEACEGFLELKASFSEKSLQRLGSLSPCADQKNSVVCETGKSHLPEDGVDQSLIKRSHYSKDSIALPMSPSPKEFKSHVRVDTVDSIMFNDSGEELEHFGFQGGGVAAHNGEVELPCADQAPSVENVDKLPIGQTNHTLQIESTSLPIIQESSMGISSVQNVTNDATPLNNGNEHQPDDMGIKLSPFDMKTSSQHGLTRNSFAHHTLEGETTGHDISNGDSEMDCRLSSSPSHGSAQNKHTPSQKEREEGTKPNDHIIEEEVSQDVEPEVTFAQLLAQGTVNSSRRKRARSPLDILEDPFLPAKKMKLSTGDQNSEGSPLCHRPCDLQRPSFRESESPSFGLVELPYSLAGLQGLRKRPTDASRNDSQQSTPCFKGLYGKKLDFHGFSSLQKGVSDVEESCNTLSAKTSFTLGWRHMDTPVNRLLSMGLSEKSNPARERLETLLDTDNDEEGKENKNPKFWLPDESRMVTGLLEKQESAKSPRVVLGYANHDIGAAENLHKRYNLAASTSSFLDLVQKKQGPHPYPNGKREVRVKALEAAELARKQEEKREHERRFRKLEGNEARGTELDCLQKEKALPTRAVKGVTNKVKRVAELKMKMDQEKAKKQEEEQRKKEEEWKKKEVEFALKKRKREDAERKEREEKRKRVEDMQRLRKELEERQRLELDEKEQKHRALEERERERKAQEEEAKRQRRIEKEKEAEMRRKREQDAKAMWLAEKQMEKKRREALLQARDHEEDKGPPRMACHKLSTLSIDSLSVASSADWEGQFTSNAAKSYIRAQALEGGSSAPSVLPFMAGPGLTLHCPSMNRGVSTSTAFESTSKLSVGSVCQEKTLNPKVAHSSCSLIPAPLNVENGIQSYEISPYKSSSDEEEDNKPTKPIPSWARKENLVPSLIQQQCIDPDMIFLSDKTCSLAEIFGTTGSRKRKDFSQRSATGDWLDDHATWKEELDYKITMGYA